MASSKGQHYAAWQGVVATVPGAKKKAPRRQVLDAASGYVSSGDGAADGLVALLGPSGSGKTTLLTLLAGHELAAEGTLMLDGRTYDEKTGASVGFVPQQDRMFATLTVGETVRLAARLRGVEDGASRVADVMRELGLEDVKDTRIGDPLASRASQRGVSGGERKRCALALELLHAPPLLVVDEPTSGLDSRGAVGVMRVLATLAAKQAVICSLHQPSARALGFVRQLGLLSPGGRTLYWGPADAAPGTYRGAVTVRELGGGGEERVGLAISVDGDAPPLPEHGDAELWRQSRLRWLDSTAGDGAVDMATVAAEGGAAAAAVRSGWGPHRSRADVWQRVQLDEATLTMTASGRRAVRLSRRGLPASIAVGGVELLHEPMQLRLVRPSGAELRWQPHPDEPGSAPVVFSRDAAGGVEWRARGVVSSGADARGGSGTPVPAGCRGLSVAVHGVLHTDGLAQLHVSLQASPSAHHLTPLSSSPSSSHAAPPPECELADVQLLAPLVERETRLINGFGVKGAARPDEVLFRWKERQVGWGQAGLNCRVWLGGAAAGVQLNLQGLEQSQSASSSHCGTVKVAVLARPWLASTVLSACI